EGRSPPSPGISRAHHAAGGDPATAAVIPGRGFHRCSPWPNAPPRFHGLAGGHVSADAVNAPEDAAGSREPSDR
ncbi:hypothetical protein LTR75_018295, partial [Friedmanniomyces endolithicus]